VRETDNLTTFACRMSRNLGALTSWKPLGHTGPVTGLFTLHKITSFPLDEFQVSAILYFRPGLLFCDKGNFGKVLFACVQHGIQHAERIMNKCTFH
jgi:hypothetical protein